MKQARSECLQTNNLPSENGDPWLQESRVSVSVLCFEQRNGAE
jgi:hypothetical protein